MNETLNWIESNKKKSIFKKKCEKERDDNGFVKDLPNKDIAFEIKGISFGIYSKGIYHIIF